MENVALFRPSPAETDSEDLAAEIAALAPWSQNIRLPDGTETAPGQTSAHRAAAQWEQIRDYLPADLTGCHALVINGNAGYHALELVRRGAQVTLTDENPHFLRQARWAATKHGAAHHIELLRGHMNHLAAWRGRPDVVLWLEGLHALRYPLLGLDIVAQLARRCVILGLPAATFEEGDDATPELGAWWAFEETMTTLVRSAGLDQVANPGPGLFVCQPFSSASQTPVWKRSEFLAATGGLPSGLNRFGDELPIAPNEIPPLTIAAP